jgi:2-keto-4-pentenoate hydratase/2-oxohepta-3-ene-1,7-dioic acid hydratase in catechol pathway
MKIVSFSQGGGAVRPGVLFEDTGTILDLSAQGFSSTLDVIERGLPSVVAAGKVALSEVRLHAPIANPPRVFAIGLNYKDHAAEAKLELPKYPIVFFKLTTSIVGPGEAIVLPKNSTKVDYEAELAVVIGKGGYRIPAEKWREHVFGYTIVNDVSARDVQAHTAQWSLAKSFPSFCPLGPAIVTANEIADPHELAITLSIDGEMLQNSNTRELIFKTPELIEYISSITPLLPGDVISTGTPAGVGLGRTPRRWLKAGETVKVSIEGLGDLVNPVVAEPVENRG